MEENQVPNTDCCPRFNPEPWQDKEIYWDNKPFIKDHITAIFHVPINFGQVIARLWKKVKDAQAIDENTVCLSDENSLWGSDIYLSVSKEVPDAENVTLSGNFLTKVFEGSYSNVKTWVNEMNEFVKSRGKEAKKMYFYYTTCPKCSKAYGENYVVIFAQV